MKKLTIFALALSVIASCSKEDSVTIGSGKSSNVVNFSAGAISRVTTATDDEQKEYDSWEDTDEIGITTVGFDGVNSATEYSNVMYTSTKTAKTTTFANTTAPILYPNTDAGSVVFKAYYPYDAQYMNDNDYITVDVSEQNTDGYGSVDFMTAKTASIAYGYNYDDDNIDANGNNTPVAFTFNHELAKIVISVSLNDNLLSLAGLQTTISGVYDKVGYDISGEKDSNFTATTDSFLIKSVVDAGNKTATITAIIHPMAKGDLTNAKLTFVVDEKNSKSEKKSFSVGFDYAHLANNVYSYSIELGNDYTKFDGDSTITDWTKYNEGTATPLTPTEII